MRYTLGFAIVAVAASASAQAPPIDIATARTYFDEVRQLSAADGGHLWGRPVAGPMLFVDPETGFIVANRADKDGQFKSQDGVWVGKLPDGMVPANTGMDVGGTRWAMIMWPVPDNRYARRRLLMHESFHRIQDSLRIPGMNPSNAQLAGADGRIWLRLEFRALTEALLRNGEERRQAVHDALVFRAKRHSLFPASASDEERQLELNEGLAEYTGFVLSGLPRAVLADRAAIQLAQQEQQESQSRSFAYASGPAYGLLLDASGIPWRAKIVASSDLSAMTGAAYNLGNISAAGAESLVDKYSGARMVAAEKTREATRIAQEARLRARFLESATLTLPVASRFNFSFDPNGAVPLSGLGTVYESSRVSDEWGTLDVSGGGVLIRRNETGRITSVVVSSPTVKDRTVEGEGWKLTLAPGWTVTESTARGQMTVSHQQ